MSPRRKTAALRQVDPAMTAVGQSRQGRAGPDVNPRPVSSKPGLKFRRLRFARAAPHHPQSSSASRFTAAQAGFFILSQSDDRPER